MLILHNFTGKSRIPHGLQVLHGRSFHPWIIMCLRLYWMWCDREEQSVTPKDERFDTLLSRSLWVRRPSFAVSLHTTWCSTINVQSGCFSSTTCVCLPPHPVQNFKVQILRFRKTYFGGEKVKEGCWFVLESNNDSSGKAPLSWTFHPALSWSISWQMRATVRSSLTVLFHWDI